MQRRSIEKEIGDSRLKLHAGKGYFYFAFQAGRYYRTESIYTYRLHDYPLERWVAEGKEFISSCEEEMKRRSAWKPGTPISLSYRKC